MTKEKYQEMLARCKNPLDWFVLQAWVLAEEMGFKYIAIWVDGFVERIYNSHIMVSIDLIRKELNKRAKEKPFLIKKCN